MASPMTEHLLGVALPSGWLMAAQGAELNFTCLDGARTHGVSIAVQRDANLKMDLVHLLILGTKAASQIQPPDREVQDAGKTDPCQIGHEQNPGNHRTRPEYDHCRCDCQPEQKHFHERKAGFFKAEEDARPQHVQNQLNAEQGQRHLGTGEAFLPPNQPCSDGHTEIEG